MRSSGGSPRNGKTRVRTASYLRSPLGWAIIIALPPLPRCPGCFIDRAGRAVVRSGWLCDRGAHDGRPAQ